jgi:hypothetical protein
MIPRSTGLVWGIKRSLLGYIRRLPDGRISVGDGVGLTSQYDFHFPLLDATDLDRAGAGIIRFGGYVHLFGHLGAMSVTLTNPWLHLDEGVGSLSFDATDDESAEPRAVLFSILAARPSALEGTLRWNGLRPILTPAGAELFEFNYPAGTAFDPIDVRTPLAG